MNTRLALPGIASLALVGSLALAGCAPGSDSAGTIRVKASDTACDLSQENAPAGTVTFSVTNGGSDVTEFEILTSGDERIVSEAEDIGPGLSRDLVVRLPEGSYVVACVPGQSGDGIRTDFAVTASDSDVTLSFEHEETPDADD
jgi:iron uptake system component EfeO